MNLKFLDTWLNREYEEMTDAQFMAQGESLYSLGIQFEMNIVRHKAKCYYMRS